MSSRVLGGRRLIRKLSQLPAGIRADVDKMTLKSGDELVHIAKVLIPVGGDVHGDGHEREKITRTPNADGSVSVDFGPKSKLIEGERGPRPFVNPALTVLHKRHKARTKRAVNRAVKRVFNG